MKLKSVHLNNFRRLEDVVIGFEDKETIFVGPNNSGKTSATAAFQNFLVRQDFKVHDFSVSKISELNTYGAAVDGEGLSPPSMSMDVWFSIDPDIEFGRVFSLIPNISGDLDKVGIRIEYCAKDPEKLLSDYRAAFPPEEGDEEPKSLSHYLSLSGNLNRHFQLNYFSLEDNGGDIDALPLEPEEGKRVLQSLVRVDFVDAQRNIDDNEAGRSNRLSKAFAAFYKKNLEQADVNEEANRIIDKNNKNLTGHYEEHFNPLMQVIQGLGVPSVNDREMRIVSSLSPETALQGNTSLLYVDTALNHELPEAYNGLGFKNLVYMAIQISHFHLQWMNTEKKRPLCQIIFVEEPEVHLHAQVQQTFISNIWEVIRSASESKGEIHMVPQLGVTTHSSHILDAVDFKKIRYFRRCPLEGEDPVTATTLNASKVLDLRDFKAGKASAAGVVENGVETIKFLQRYLKLTHCDLFFADAAIIVEGTVEKLLLPTMIEKTASKLKLRYLTILEVGGAYSHRFSSLLEFLGIPYLVITDIDSVDPANNGKVCRADTVGAVTSNASLEFFLNLASVEDFVGLNTAKQVLADGKYYVAYQRPTSVDSGGVVSFMHGRTLEETFVYQNMQLFRDGVIGIGVDISAGQGQDREIEYRTVYERVKSSSFKKAEFALDVVSSTGEWITPQYIADGLVWLDSKLSPNPNEADE